MRRDCSRRSQIRPREIWRHSERSEASFDAVMDRAPAGFKRRQQCVALVVSSVIVLSANIDTFKIADALAI